MSLVIVSRNTSAVCRSFSAAALPFHRLPQVPPLLYGSNIPLAKASHRRSATDQLQYISKREKPQEKKRRKKKREAKLLLLLLWKKDKYKKQEKKL